MSKIARDIMTKNVVVVQEDMNINDLIKLFIERKISCVPVISDNGALAGIVTKTDILGHFLDLDLEISLKVALQDILEHMLDYQATAVSAETELNAGKIMSTDPLTADVETPIPELAKRMIDSNIHRLIITEHGDVCGLISTIDMLYHIAEIDKHERKM